MSWEVIKRKDGKVTISVTMDEFVGILPPEVDELIEEYNTERVPFNDFLDKIDMDAYFSKKSITTFNVDPKDIKIREEI